MIQTSGLVEPEPFGANAKHAAAVANATRRARQGRGPSGYDTLVLRRFEFMERLTAFYLALPDV
jgi:hypothetical protein